MPETLFRCDDCGAVFEEEEREQSDLGWVCPECGSMYILPER